MIVDVIGKPVPQGSLSSFVSKTTGRVVSPQKQSLRDWRSRVAESFAAAVESSSITFPLSGPLGIELFFRLERPASHYRSGRFSHLLKDSAPSHATGRPDIDKMTRSVLDALGGADLAQRIRLFEDDSQIVLCLAAKRWTVYGEEPGVRIYAGALAESVSWSSGGTVYE